jgi:FlaA1/EpsC-like NDP-sugar epimerase
MTIPEAAQLVLQASAMGLGGDVFVLDMGEPMRILELAERMVRLSGCSVRGADNPEGEIEIQFSGLRPGEKLYEELMLGEHVAGTGHPMIMRAEDEYPTLEQLQSWLEELDTHCDEMNCDSIKAVLMAAVSGFHEHQELHDHLWNKQRAAAQPSTSNVQELFPEGTPDQ